jgi:hypothetical protein
MLASAEAAPSKLIATTRSTTETVDLSQQKERFGDDRIETKSGEVMGFPKKFRRESLVDVSTVKALAFDVFGTVVDWRSAVIRYGEELGREKGLNID